MAKNKLLFHSGLYDLKMYQGERRYRILPSNNEIFEKILNNENTELVCNFDEKKDHRNENSRNSNYLCIDFKDLFQKANPKIDFTFIQNPSSKSKWDIRHGYYWADTEHPNYQFQSDNTFSFTGKINSIWLKNNANFKNLIFNQTLPLEKNRYDELISTSVNFSSPEAKTITFNNFGYLNLEISDPAKLEKININNSQKICINKIECDTISDLTFGGIIDTRIECIRSNSLKKITILPTNLVKLDINNFKAPKLKTIDLTQAKWVKLFTSISDINCIFNSLNLDFSSHGYSWREEKKDLFKEFQNDYKNLLERINPNCKIILNPESYISTAFLPTKKDNFYSELTNDEDILSKTYKVKEVIQPNAQGKYEISILDFAKMFYKEKKKDVDLQIQKLDLLMKNLPKFEEKFREKYSKHREEEKIR